MSKKGRQPAGAAGLTVIPSLRYSQKWEESSSQAGGLGRWGEVWKLMKEEETPPPAKPASNRVARKQELAVSDGVLVGVKATGLEEGRRCRENAFMTSGG